MLEKKKKNCWIEKQFQTTAITKTILFVICRGGKEVLQSNRNAISHNMPTKEFLSAGVCHRNGLWAIGLKSLLVTGLSIKWFDFCSYDTMVVSATAAVTVRARRQNVKNFANDKHNLRRRRFCCGVIIMN